MSGFEWVPEAGLLGLAAIVIKWARPIVDRLVNSHLAFVDRAGEELTQQGAKIDRLLEESAETRELVRDALQQKGGAA